MTISRVRTSVICIHQDKLLGFFAEDPYNKKNYFFLPGGQIEPHETAPEAASRETLEETGYSVSIDDKFCVDKEYLFEWNNQTIDCLTLFYRANLNRPFAQPVQDASYHRGVHWLPLADLQQAFSYSQDILDAIKEILKKN